VCSLYVLPPPALSYRTPLLGNWSDCTRDYSWQHYISARTHATRTHMRTGVARHSRPWLMSIFLVLLAAVVVNAGALAFLHVLPVRRVTARGRGGPCLPAATPKWIGGCRSQRRWIVWVGLAVGATRCALFMYVCVYVHMNIYIYICVYSYIYISIYVYICK